MQTGFKLHRHTIFQLLLMLAVLSALIAPVMAQSRNFKVYRPKDGLPQTQVSSVCQTSDGYLWAGTLSGVGRYNGRDWTIFTIKDGLVHNEVRAIAEDAEGHVVFGTLGRGICIYDGVSFKGFPEDEFLGSCQVSDILLDREGALWVAADEGLAVIKNGEVRVFTTEDGLPGPVCYRVFQRRDGGIWVGGKDNPARFDGIRFSTPPDLLERPVTNVKALVEGPGDILYLGSDAGVFRFDGQIALPIQVDQNKRFEVSDAIRDRFGNLWFTGSGGILQISPKGGLDLIGPWAGLSHPIVHAVFSDREDNLWFGTEDGLNKLSPGPFLVYNQKHGLAGDIVRTMYEDASGAIWVGTRMGISVLQDGGFTDVVDNRRLSHRRVYSIAGHPDGRILIGAIKGLTVFDPKTKSYTKYLQGPNFPLDDVRKVFVDRKKRIWLGGTGLFRWDESGFLPAEHQDVLRDAVIIDIIEDFKGNLWIGTRNKGLLVYSPGQPLIVHDIFSEAIWDLALDAQGNIWIGTNGLGLYRHDGHEFTSFTSAEGLTDEFIWQVLCASNGEIWVGHNRGVDRFSNGRFVNYNVSDGLAYDEAVATAVLEDSRGDLWFGSGGGLTRYQSALNQGAPPPPLMVLEFAGYENDGTFQPIPQDTRRLRRFQNNLRFTFAGIALRNEETVVYSYKLEGLGKWMPASSDNFAPFNNLNSGNYNFLVKARGESGEWSKPAEFHFTILPAFWETWWFRILVGLIVLAVVGSYHRARIVWMQRKNRVLETLVLQRTRELEEKNEELHRLSLSDALTKLRNRRYLTEIMPMKIQTVKRKLFKVEPGSESFKHAIGIIMLDMDYFKSVNDTYGHEAGDRVLKQLSAILRESVRTSDIVVRWGGEEFLIVLNDAGKGLNGTMAQRILKRVRETDLDIGAGKTIRRTCSAGFAYYPGHEALDHVTWEDTIKMADKALYTAKAGGRDMVCGLGFNQGVEGYELAEALKGDIDEGIENHIFVPLDEDEFQLDGADAQPANGETHAESESETKTDSV